MRRRGRRSGGRRGRVRSAVAAGLGSLLGLVGGPTSVRGVARRRRDAVAAGRWVRVRLVVWCGFPFLRLSCHRGCDLAFRLHNSLPGLLPVALSNWRLVRAPHRHIMMENAANALTLAQHYRANYTNSNWTASMTPCIDNGLLRAQR